MIGYFYNSSPHARRSRPCSGAHAAKFSALGRDVGTIVVERPYDMISILAVFFVAQPWLPHVSWFGTAAIVAIGLALPIASVAAVLAI